MSLCSQYGMRVYTHTTMPTPDMRCVPDLMSMRTSYAHARLQTCPCTCLHMHMSMCIHMSGSMLGRYETYRPRLTTASPATSHVHPCLYHPRQHALQTFAACLTSLICTCHMYMYSYTHVCRQVHPYVCPHISHIWTILRPIPNPQSPIFCSSTSRIPPSTHRAVTSTVTSFGYARL